ncbi:MAG: sigma 54-interacting transcriptional regulator [Desulfobacterales bacterium]|nr:sigma 54-interacting transcriptional regulator [Desulfobacterales bacterium]
MKYDKKLSSKDREFFSLVEQAVQTNPFSDEREKIDIMIAGESKGASVKQRLDRTEKKISARIALLEKSERIDIRKYAGKDRMLIEHSLLFDYFHTFMDNFDRHIVDQIKSGDNPIPVNFFREALSRLQDHGFNAQDSNRYFSMLFQIRRAYYFIDHNLVGRSACMRELRRKLWNNVFTHNIDLYNKYLWDRMEDFSTLIFGETGTGKGTSAIAIGRSGYIPFDEKRGCFKESFTRAFTPLNFSQFSESLIESELFGHKKGAFTGAVDHYKGIFDRCSKYGSIFLDEIGDVSQHIQIKLLKVLQERTFTPVGSHEQNRFNGRVIAATNRSIDEVRRKGAMRDDFYYRLCSDIITVPPLRQRLQEDPGELDDLLAHTVTRMMGKQSPELINLIRNTINKELGNSYTWPGNVRELEQCARRVILNRHYEGDLKPISSDIQTTLSTAMTNGDLNMQELTAGYCHMLFKRFGTYEEVAKKTGLDRRTAKKHILAWVD